MTVLPLVSVIVTSYNRAKWIGQTIESILSQDYANFELVISDNDSSDETDEIVSKYLSDPRVKYFKNSHNIGMIANFHKAFFELAQGELLTHVSSDDYLCNNAFLSEAVSAYQSNPSLEIYMANTIMLDEPTGSISDNETYLFYKDSYYKRGSVDGKECFMNFPKKGMISFGACFFKKQTLQKIDIDLTISTSLDFLIILQIILFGDVFFSDKRCYVFRQHAAMASVSFNTSDIFIKNFRFIEVASQTALRENIFSAAVLDNWRSEMIFPHLRYSLHHLLKINRDEFEIMNAYAIGKYPALQKRIVREPKFLVKKIIAALKK